jgi:hypothetical protein
MFWTRVICTVIPGNNLSQKQKSILSDIKIEYKLILNMDDVYDSTGRDGVVGPHDKTLNATSHSEKKEFVDVYIITKTTYTGKYPYKIDYLRVSNDNLIGYMYITDIVLIPHFVYSRVNCIYSVHYVNTVHEIIAERLTHSDLELRVDDVHVNDMSKKFENGDSLTFEGFPFFR